MRRTLNKLPSLIIIITVILMEINRLIIPFPDIAVRIIGSVMLINIVIFSYSAVKSNRCKKET